MPIRDETFRIRADVDTRRLRDAANDVQHLGNELDSLDTGGFTGGIDAASSSLLNFQTIAGGTALAAGALAVNSILERQNAMNLLAAQTGAVGKELEALQSVGDKVFVGGFGEGLNEVLNTVQLARNITGEADGALQGIVEDAETLAKLDFGEQRENIRAAKALVDNFGLSYSQSFDLMLAANQRGVNVGDDLIDTVAEYSANFAQAGFDATQFFDIVGDGTAAGARNTDDLADAVREFQIKLTDRSSEHAIRRLSNETSALFDAWRSGDADVADVFAEVMVQLRGMSNEAERNEIFAEIFGTKWEDVGERIFLAIDTADNAFDGFEGSMDSAQDKLDDGLSPAVERTKRGLSTLFSQLATPIATPAFDNIATGLETLGSVFTLTLGVDVEPPTLADADAAAGEWQSLLDSREVTTTYTIQAGDTAEDVAAALGVTVQEATRLMREQGGFVSVAVQPSLAQFAAALGVSIEEAERIVEESGFGFTAPISVSAEAAAELANELGITFEEARARLEREALEGARVNLPVGINPQVIEMTANALDTTYAEAERILNAGLAEQGRTARTNVNATITSVRVETPPGSLPVRFAEEFMNELPPAIEEELSRLDIVSSYVASVGIAGYEFLANEETDLDTRLELQRTVSEVMDRLGDGIQASIDLNLAPINLIADNLPDIYEFLANGFDWIDLGASGELVARNIEVLTGINIRPVFEGSDADGDGINDAVQAGNRQQPIGLIEPKIADSIGDRILQKRLKGSLASTEPDTSNPFIEWAIPPEVVTDTDTILENLREANELALSNWTIPVALSPKTFFKDLQKRLEATFAPRDLIINVKYNDGGFNPNVSSLPKFHNGGYTGEGSGEFLALLQRGETVVPPGGMIVQPSRDGLVAVGGGGGETITINEVHIHGVQNVNQMYVELVKRARGGF